MPFAPKKSGGVDQRTEPDIYDERHELQLPPGFALAALPILGYAGAFIYEAGRCQFFRLPLELIRLDLTTGFIVALGIISFGLWVGSMFILLITLEHLPPRVFSRMLPALGVGLTVMLLAGVILSVGLYLLTTVVIVLVLNRLYNRARRETPEQMVEALARWRGLGPLWATFSDFLGQRYFIYLFVVLNLLAASYNLGFFAASQQTVFLTKDDYAVVAIYGDTFIALQKAVARNGAISLGSHMKLFKVADQVPLTLNRSTLGHVLRPNPQGRLAEFFFKI